MGIWELLLNTQIFGVNDFSPEYPDFRISEFSPESPGF